MKCLVSRLLVVAALVAGVALASPRPALAQSTLSFPTANQTVAPTVTFTWTATPGAQRYYLYVGTSIGAKDLVDTGEIATLSYTRAGLPTGMPIYARVYTKLSSGVWVASPDVTFRCGTPLAVTATTREPLTWAGTQEVPGYTVGVPYPNYPLIASAWVSSTPLPYTVPPGCWLGITYGYVGGKFGNHDRPGYLVIASVAAVSEGGSPLSPSQPIFVGPGFVLAPYFINNTAGEAEYMTGVVQGTQYCGIDARATLRDVAAAFGGAE